MAVEEIDGVYYVSNPADAPMSKDILDETTSYYRSEVDRINNSYVGSKIDTGFEIKEEIAHGIIRHYAPEKLYCEADNYTIATIGKCTLLIARDANHIVQYTVEIDNDIKDVQYSPDFDKVIEDVVESRKSAKKIMIMSNVFFVITVILTLVLVGLVMYTKYGGMRWYGI